MNAQADMSKPNLAEGSSASFLIRWKGRQEGPYPANLIAAKLAAHEISLLHEIFHKGQWVSIGEYLAEWKDSDPHFSKRACHRKTEGEIAFLRLHVG